MLDQKAVKRPKKGDTVITRFGDAKVLQIHGSTGTALTVSTERHGTERIERADAGWWTIRQPVAWGAWNQGHFPSVRKAMRHARKWLTHPDNTNEHPRLFLIRHDARPGWRLVNCGNRQPMTAELEQGFYGPLTPQNIAAKCEAHRA